MSRPLTSLTSPTIDEARRPSAGAHDPRGLRRSAARAARLPRERPELLALLLLAGVLNLWALGQNGWANDYYSAAVRSMSTSWHDFLFASMDPSGVMTVDKPPLALWVQALSVRAFGFHPLAMLVPQALMGVASVAFVYDLVRRPFGRVAGFTGGLALALTPIAVAVSRHNNPDALLVLCSTAALWLAVRWFEDGRMRWLVGAGVAVGLGFETKMAAALLIVPAIAVAALWIAPRGRLSALRGLLAGGASMLVVGGAWPLLTLLVPAAARPWISGTSDNSVLSLIFGYNGLGRVDGQAGGPAGAGGPGGGFGGGGSMFGGSSGPLRLLNPSLGGQAGWLLGFALVGGLGILVATRLRRADARSGWLIAVGGAFLVTAVVFSQAKGIFHPYYTSLLAPFAAALVGGTVGLLLRGGTLARIVAPLAIAAGVASELIVLHNNPGTLTGLAPILIAVGVVAAVALAVTLPARLRAVALAAVLAALLLAPASWAVDTLGHATSGTFPAGGPAAPLGQGPGGAVGRTRPGARSSGPGGFGAPGGAMPAAPTQGLGGGAPAAGGPGGGMFGRGGSQLTSVLTYVNSHGGGTIAVSSQSTAAASIIASGAKVAGIGGFSGRESEVSAGWLAQEVQDGAIRWVDGAGSGGGRGGFGDGRVGATKAMTTVANVCTSVTLPAGATSAGRATGATGAVGGSSGTTLYDCQGKAAALRAAGSAS
jgi:4-amino-4-deoxy-L-arabinose transferase-like glycosyltransferase